MSLKNCLQPLLKKIPSFLWHPIAILITGGIVFAYDMLIRYWDWISANLFRFNEVLHKYSGWTHLILGTIVYLALVIMGTLYYKIKMGHQAMKMGQVYCGIGMTTKQRERNWSQLKKDGDDEVGHLAIMGTTGHHTFRDPKSPLHTALQKCKDVKVILMDPDNPHLSKRARNLGMTPTEYRKKILDSIDYLSRLATNKARSISLKTYKTYPVWKLMIIDKIIWVQQYPVYKTIHESPCLAFRQLNGQDGHGIYSQLFEQFLNRWNRDHLNTIDLLNYPTDPPDQQPDTTPST